MEKRVNASVEQFKTIVSGSEKRTVQVFVNACEQVVTDLLQELDNKRAGKGKGARTKSDTVRPVTWNQIWSRREVGGKDFFKDRYEELKEEGGEKNHFKLLKLLRDWAETTDGGKHWREWHEHAREVLGDEAPKDPPSERKELTEKAGGKKAGGEKAEGKKTGGKKAGDKNATQNDSDGEL